MQQFEPIQEFNTELKLPGDKSISHRALILSAMANGKSKITNLSNGLDVQSTIECLKNLGVQFHYHSNELVVDGCGYKGFREPSQPLYAGNSGTTARLLSGILAAQDFPSQINGDESLSKRPMDRISDPLLEMNADISLTGKTLPIKFNPAKNLKPIKYTMPVASAQVKSTIILCGLHLDDQSEIYEPIQTRDHTERMLGLNVEERVNFKKIIFSKKKYPEPKEYFCPSDFSSAAFFSVLTLLMRNSQLRIKDVTLNPTRTGLLNLLQDMGARIEIENEKEFAGEPFGDVIVSSSQLKNIQVPKKIIPNIIDELPVLSIASLFADGDLEIHGAEELRFKETDRIKALVHNFKLLGLEVDEYPDGFKISGEIKNTKVVFDSYNDHRIAMAFSILSILLNSEPKVDNFSCVKISNPDFLSQLKQLNR